MKKASIFFIFVLVTVIFIITNNRKGIAQENGQVSLSSHEQFIAILESIEKGKSFDSSQLRLLAQNRREAIKNLIEKDPLTVRLLFQEIELYKNIPKDVQPFLEKRGRISGRMVLEINDDFDNNKSTEKFYLLTKNNKKLRTVGETAEFYNYVGSEITVDGYDIDEYFLLSESTSESSALTVDSYPPASSKSQRTAYIMFNFRNNTSEPYSRETVETNIFTDSSSADAFFREMSFGQIDLIGNLNPDGDIFGWYTLPYDNNNDCSSNLPIWEDAAITRATQEGLVKNNYDILFFGFPSAGCSATGQAVSGNTPDIAFMQGSFNKRVATHEMGHTLGVFHASTLSCTDEQGKRIPIGGNCTTSEYGDLFDIMDRGTGHMNSGFKEFLNLYPAEQVYSITNPGTYTVSLVPMEFKTPGIQAIKFPKTVDSAGKVLEYYILEFRQPYGFDSFKSTDPVANGVGVRYIQTNAYPRTYLIDTTAETTSFSDSALSTGKTFTDTENGISVTTKSVSSSQAVVEINYSGNHCVHANPVVSFLPYDKYVKPGDTRILTIQATNVDSQNCNPAIFDITTGKTSSYMTVTPSTYSETLSPNESFSKQLTVSFASNMPESKPFIVQYVRNRFLKDFMGYKTANFNVSNTLPSPSPSGASLPTPIPTPSASPIYTIEDLKTAMDLYGSADDSRYWPKDGKVNTVDLVYIMIHL